MDRHREAIAYLYELLNCTELNMDDMEPATLELIDEIHEWLDGVRMPADQDAQGAEDLKLNPPEQRGFV